MSQIKKIMTQDNIFWKQNDYNDDVTPINKLDIHRLEHVFSYLPILDRFKIQRVCTRWQEVSKDLYIKFKKLDLSKEAWGCSVFGPGQLVTKKNYHILQKFLSKCGRYITNIKLIFIEEFDQLLAEKKFDFIGLGQSCPNLEVIDLISPNLFLHFHLEDIAKHCNKVLEIKIQEISSAPNFYRSDQYAEILSTLFSNNKKLKAVELIELGMFDEIPLENLQDSIERFTLNFSYEKVISIKSLKTLKNLKTLKLYFLYDEYDDDIPDIKNYIVSMQQICSNLTKLNLCMLGESCEKQLSQLFHLCKLRNLKIEDSKITGKCLLNLSKDLIQKIKLINCSAIKSRYLKSALSNCEYLILIKLEKVSNVSKECIQVVGNQIKLVSLSLIEVLTKSSLITTDDSLNYILELKNLKFLNLSNNFLVKDDLLINISKHMTKLSIINLNSCKSITDNGLRAICKLPELKHLFISYINQIVGEGFENIPNLITLDCTHCVNITDKHLCKVVTNSPNLQFIDVSNCSKVTLNFIIFTNMFVKVRTNSSTILSIRVDSSNKNFMRYIKDQNILGESISKNLNFIYYGHNEDYLLNSGLDYLHLKKY